MEKILPQLRLDQKVWAIVEEVNGRSIIVNFQGDLARVENHSHRRLRPGQRIQLLVTAISPLGFKLLEFRKENVSNLKLDISI